MLLKDVEKYAKLCRKLGVSYLKVDGLELNLTDHAPEEPSKVVVEPLKEVSDAPAYSDEELLLWSTQGNFEPPPSDN